MANERIECIPSLTTPKPLPRPEPLQKTAYNLDLTPEKKPNVSRHVKVDNGLSVPTLNSTAKIQLQIENLKCRKKIIVPQATSHFFDPTIAQCVKSNVLKVLSNNTIVMCIINSLQAVNIPFNTKLYTDLVSVDVPSEIADACTVQAPHCYKTTKIAEGPDILDLYPSIYVNCAIHTFMYS